MQARRTTVGLAEHVGDPGPELARRTEFRDRHELVVVGHQPEADLAQRLGDIDAGVDQQPHVAHRRAHRPGQLPCRVGAAVVEGGAVDGDRPHPGPGRQAGGECHHVLDRGRVASADRCGQRVGAQVDRHRRAGGVVRAGHQRQDRVGRGRPVSAGVEQDRRQIQVDTLEKAVDVGGRNPASADPQHQGTDSVGERVQAPRHCRRPRRRCSRGPGRTRPPSSPRRRRDGRHRHGRTARRRAAAVRATRRARCRARGSESPRRWASRAGVPARQPSSAGSRRLLLASTPATAVRQRARCSSTSTDTGNSCCRSLQPVAGYAISYSG